MPFLPSLPSLSHRTSFRLWLITGFFTNWLLLTFIVCTTVTKDSAQMCLFSLGFIPACLAIHWGTLSLWHRERTREMLGAVTRVVASCVGVNIWATGCVVVGLKIKSAMMIAVWWFFILPTVVFLMSKVVVDAMTFRM